MPRGGKREGSGRKAGVPNKATAEIKALAQAYGPAAIARLALLSGLTKEPGSESETTQVVAMKELLDRGYGKSAQILAGDKTNPLFPKVMVAFGADAGDDS